MKSNIIKGKANIVEFLNDNGIIETDINYRIPIVVAEYKPAKNQSIMVTRNKGGKGKIVIYSRMSKSL